MAQELENFLPQVTQQGLHEKLVCYSHFLPATCNLQALLLLVFQAETLGIQILGLTSEQVHRPMQPSFKIS